MFDPDSRYAPLPTRALDLPDGRRVAYKSRRFLPPGQSLTLLAEVTTTQADRLDLITARTLGTPELYWHICDANDAMNPIDLVDEPGRILRVPMPNAQQHPISMPLSSPP